MFEGVVGVLVSTLPHLIYRLCISQLAYVTSTSYYVYTLGNQHNSLTYRCLHYIAIDPHLVVY